MNIEKNRNYTCQTVKRLLPEGIIAVRDEYIIHIHFLTHVIIFYSNFFKNQNMTFIYKIPFLCR